MTVLGQALLQSCMTQDILGVMTFNFDHEGQVVNCGEAKKEIIKKTNKRKKATIKPPTTNKRLWAALLFEDASVTHTHPLVQMTPVTPLIHG